VKWQFSEADQMYTHEVIEELHEVIEELLSPVLSRYENVNITICIKS
jgi:hypothetical protein